MFDYKVADEEIPSLLQQIDVMNNLAKLVAS
jgi:hypothetical protein